VSEAAKGPTAAKRARPKRPTRNGQAGRAGEGARLRVKQVRSGIGHAETYRRTLRALGIRHHQHEIVVGDTPAIRGMLDKVRHLVRVTREEA
jgi:large subunit ribosomal protein L30